MYKTSGCLSERAHCNNGLLKLTHKDGSNCPGKPCNMITCMPGRCGGVSVQAGK